MNIFEENKAYLLRFTRDFSYSRMPWVELMRTRFLETKYNKPVIYKSFSIWRGIVELYDIILGNTHWIVGNDEQINFWNDS